MNGEIFSKTGIIINDKNYLAVYFPYEKVKEIDIPNLIKEKQHYLVITI